MMLSVTRSIFPYNISTSRKFQASGPAPASCLSETLKLKGKCKFLGSQRLQIFSARLELLHASNNKMDMAVHSGVEPGPPLSSSPTPGSWKVWILGMVISVVLPFCRNRWLPLLMIKGKIDSVVEMANHVADVVEDVAEEVGTVAEEVADHLPEGGKLKKVATVVEMVAKETAKDAHIVDQVIEKVEEVEKEIELFIQKATAEGPNEISKEAKD